MENLLPFSFWWKKFETHNFTLVLLLDHFLRIEIACLVDYSCGGVTAVIKMQPSGTVHHAHQQVTSSTHPYNNSHHEANLRGLLAHHTYHQVRTRTAHSRPTYDNYTVLMLCQSILTKFKISQKLKAVAFSSTHHQNFIFNQQGKFFCQRNLKICSFWGIALYISNSEAQRH